MLATAPVWADALRIGSCNVLQATNVQATAPKKASRTARRKFGVISHAPETQKDGKKEHTAFLTFDLFQTLASDKLQIFTNKVK
jgi:hypothetical protein